MAAINVQNFGGPIKIGSLSADPSSPVNGLIYYNTSSNTFRLYENGTWQALSGSAEVLASTFRIDDATDPTKKIAFSAATVSTATVRTITMPDADVDLGALATSASVTSAISAAIATEVTNRNTAIGVETSRAEAAEAALVENSIVSGHTTIAPSGAAVFTALAAKLSAVVGDTAPSLGGNLTLGSNVLLGAMDRAAVVSPTRFVEETYLDATTLTASSTAATASAFTFAFATYNAAQIDYVIKEATTGRTRTGKLQVCTDGTLVAFTDTFTETADCGTVWDASISGSNVILTYTTTANNKTMRADVKRFLT